MKTMRKLLLVLLALTVVLAFAGAALAEEATTAPADTSDPGIAPVIGAAATENPVPEGYSIGLFVLDGEGNTVTEKGGFSCLGSSVTLYIKHDYQIVAKYYNSKGETIEPDEELILGVEDESGNNSDVIISDALVTLNSEVSAEYDSGTSRTVVAEHEEGIWAFAIAPMPKDSATVEKLVLLSYDEGGDLNYSLQNQVMNTLDTFNDFIEVGAKVFLWVGVGFAVFSALLLMNFISISISYKKREIGILRAVGARSSDVFKIFFSESFIIAFINFVLAVIAAITTIFFINRWMRGEGINVTLLNFGLRQVALMFVISVAVAAIASFLPVWRIARRKPIDAIKDR